MCNCGNNRNELQQETKSLSGSINTNTPGKVWPGVNFVYTGKTALSVRGNITGRQYRFSHTGDVQLIDHRDVSGMRYVPMLKKA